MMNILRTLFVTASLATLASCTAPDITASHKYYDVAGLVKGQIADLSKAKIVLTKSGVLNGEAINKNMDTINWHHELDPFVLADINKPSWIGLYKVDSAKTDRGLTIFYTSTKDDLPVTRLTVLLDSDRQPLTIKATIQKLSMLNEGEQELELNFTELGGQSALIAYTTTGTEKVTLQGETRYKIRGDIKRAN